MFTEQNNLLITQTKLDDVLFEMFDGRSTFPGRANAQTSSVFKVIDTTHSAYIEAVNKGVTLFQNTAEATQIAVSTPQVANTFIVNINTYTNSIYPTKQLFDDNMFSVWSREVKDMAEKFFITQDINAFNLYNGAFTTTLCANGFPLIAANYTLLSGGTYTNFINAALTNTSLKNAITILAKQPDQAGVVMGNTPHVLLVAQDIFDDAVRITNSVLTSGSAQNDINVYLSTYGFVVYASPYMTNGTWFLLSNNHTVTRYIRQGLETALTSWQYSDNLTYKYQANFREGYGAISQVGIVGGHA